MVLVRINDVVPSRTRATLLNVMRNCARVCETLDAFKRWRATLQLELPGLIPLPPPHQALPILASLIVETQRALVRTHRPGGTHLAGPRLPVHHQVSVVIADAGLLARLTRPVGRRPGRTGQAAAQRRGPGRHSVGIGRARPARPRLPRILVRASQALSTGRTWGLCAFEAPRTRLARLHRGIKHPCRLPHHRVPGRAEHQLVDAAGHLPDRICQHSLDVGRTKALEPGRTSLALVVGGIQNVLCIL
eukprot:1334780-Rhodomonas_salina.2